MIEALIYEGWMEKYASKFNGQVIPIPLQDIL
jgi:hypothetical protein